MTELSLDAARRVEEYLSDTLIGHDAALQAALDDQDAAGMRAIEVAPVAGKLLHLLVRIAGARRVLEIGTLGGYSTIWLARAVGARGAVHTIEAEPANAAVARRSIDRAGVGERVHIHVGHADGVLPTLRGPFDFVFIDADKESNALYLEWAARLGHAGTVVVIDNIGRSGAVADADSRNSQVVGTRAALDMLGTDPRFDATALQTLDRKGWDG
ncbi:MAG: O-methyltransferase, partial [Actinobacteria bacterium]|nr:O-methyltransferase [Actinomycetota bacterium]